MVNLATKNDYTVLGKANIRQEKGKLEDVTTSAPVLLKKQIIG